MWERISIFILRFRLFFLIGLLATSALMGWLATDIKMTYDFARIIPSDNPKYIDYVEYKNTFGEDGNVMVLGVQSGELFNKDFFNDWYKLGNEITKIDGITGVLSVPHSFIIEQDSVNQFQMSPLLNGPIKSNEQMDSVRERFLNLPFYRGLIYNPRTNATLMAITFNREQLDSKDRLGMTDSIIEMTQAFEERNNIEIHYSGLPFIRSYKMTTISRELERFLLYAMIVLALILFILFRTIFAVLIPLFVVIIGAIWSLGTLVIFDYKITLLTGLIPTLIVVIGIPNCVYMLNKYHSEYKKHGNKQKALMRVISKIGHVTLFTNLTTAIGFGVFYFTETQMLSEFGLVAFLNIVATFLISLIAIPVIFSYLPEPKTRHTVHLDSRVVNFLLNTFENWVKYHRKKVYAVSAIIFIAAAVGIFSLNARGFILDDVPEDSKIYTDLLFFEKNFDGIMPFEIVIDTKKKGGATDLAFMQKIENAADTLATYEIFSKALSLTEAVKFARQGYYDENAEKYGLPQIYPGSPDNRFASSLENMKLTEGQGLASSFVDDNRQRARMSLQVADIGSDSMPKVLAKLQPQLESIFPKPDYNVKITGTSIIALEGFNFLIDGLIYSVGLAFLLIAFIMAYLFRSLRMLLLALIPNIFPLVVTAGIMGYFDIALKPSTVLIFSVAFGISVDYTIHFLAKYRQELLRHNWDISKTVMVSLRETGVSMIYTSLILFFGFIIFTASDFDGTVNLGRLTSVTLVVAMMSNLVILPSLLASFERIVNRKAIKKEPLIDVYNEEEDIEMDKLDFKHERQ